MTDTPPPGASDADIAFFRDLARTKLAPSEKPRAAGVRLSGLVLGALAGLAYGLLSQTINEMLLPGIPLAHHPFGPFGNCALAIVVGGLVGVVCAWPAGSINGALAGALAMTIALEARGMIINNLGIAQIARLDFAAVTLAGAATVLFFTLPVALLLRWAIDSQFESRRSALSWARVKGPLALAALACGAGALACYPGDTRQALRDMNVLIQRGLKAASVSALPEPLRNENKVIDFMLSASPRYSLEESEDPVLRRGLGWLSRVNSVIVAARFEGGWTLVCLHERGGAAPECRSFRPNQTPRVNDTRAMR
jgi:hypothetical protein